MFSLALPLLKEPNIKVSPSSHYFKEENLPLNWIDNCDPDKTQSYC
ncbi:hypothetical protein SAMN02745866_00871 [Alteromonadaceae bacterium Bs31]|nr:hypothetical protein SAMN02745866_00871 [Alteromonadaceae bacterium Bs31]